MNFDFRSWIDSVTTFFDGLKAIPGELLSTIEVENPLLKAEIDLYVEKWPNGIPKVLQDLWLLGSRRINCFYHWTPPKNELPKLQEVISYGTFIVGGIELLPAQDIFPGNENIDPNDMAILETLGARDFALWSESAIIMRVGNGDCIGLDVKDNPSDPPVVYLSHDGPDSRRLAPSLGEFIELWTELSFLNPYFWLDHEKINLESGKALLSNFDTNKLRKLLRARDS